MEELYFEYEQRTRSNECLFFEDMHDYFESILLQGHEEDCEMQKPVAKDFSRRVIAEMEGEGDDGFVNPAEMYARQKELARLRQKKSMMPTRPSSYKKKGRKGEN